jgi:hypothetical protein
VKIITHHTLFISNFAEKKDQNIVNAMCLVKNAKIR